ncbi:hypothetical protein BH10BAC2_BH10BAC2_45580 [soil metagenome]
MSARLMLSVLMLATLFIACKRESLQPTESIASFSNSNDAAILPDTAKIPITDLGTNTFLGYVGGLYPGGANTPSGQYASDLLNYASAIVPLNSLGVSAPDGKLGFIAVGGSTCQKMMSALKNKTTGNPATNPALLMVNCTNGGGTASANSLMNPNDAVWGVIESKLTKGKLTAPQVQVIYLETDDSIQLSGFPDRPLRLKQEYQETMRQFKTKFTNLKLVYLLGRTTTFKDPKQKKISNAEPNPYYNGWACKWLIEDQINGVPGTAYKGANAVAPMVTWGWYEWAYGTPQPRLDGFTWEESDTEDGLHGTPAGEDTLSNYFQHFLLTDQTARKWYGND